MQYFVLNFAIKNCDKKVKFIVLLFSLSIIVFTTRFGPFKNKFKIFSIQFGCETFFFSLADNKNSCQIYNLQDNKRKCECEI